MLKNKIWAVAIVVVAALLAVMFWQGKQQDKAKNEYITTYYAQITPLRTQRNALQNQLNKLDQGYTEQAGGTGTLTLVCPTAAEQVYTELYPTLQAQGLTATVALVPDALPGTPGTMQPEDFLTLCTVGWEHCIVWDGQTPLEDWLPPVQEWLEENGLSRPTVMYLPPAQYTAGLDAELTANGFTTVLHHGEEGLSLVTETAEGTPWRLGVAGWNATGANDRAGSLAGAGGATAFEITFDSADETTQYEPEQFGRMLAKLATWQQGGGLAVTGTYMAVATRTAAAEAAEASRQEYENQKQATEEQLAAVEAEIKELEASWDWPY